MSYFPAYTNLVRTFVRSGFHYVGPKTLSLHRAMTAKADKPISIKNSLSTFRRKPWHNDVQPIHRLKATATLGRAGTRRDGLALRVEDLDRLI